MHLRRLTAADVPRCIDIHAGAFVDNELINYLTPDRAKYRLSWRQRAIKMQRNELYQPATWAFVCVADADDDFATPGEILGYAHWARCPSKEEAAADPWLHPVGVLERVESWLLGAELKWEETLRTNPAVSWTAMDTFRKHATASSALTPLREETRWHLDRLAVAPEFHRRGVGRRLAEWGLQRARAETEERMAVGKAPVPITLIATAPGLHLYRGLGFKVVGWEYASYLPAPAEGGSAMVWESTNYWIRDIGTELPMKRGVVEAAFTTASN